jgi:hypothetical protein
MDFRFRQILRSSVMEFRFRYFFGSIRMRHATKPEVYRNSITSTQNNKWPTLQYHQATGITKTPSKKVTSEQNHFNEDGDGNTGLT